MSVSTVDSIAKLVIYAFILAVLFLIGRLLRARHQETWARSARYGQEFSALMSLSAQQSSVIDEIILELESRPATYETFPPKLREAIGAVHDRASRQLTK